MTALFTIDHIDFNYRIAGEKEFRALEDISLEIERGEFVSIIGANGSGKTTLAQLLAALSLPTHGSVFINQINTQDRSSWTKLHQLVGMVFQNPEDQVIANLVEEDVAFGLENLGLPADEIRRRTQAALEEVGLWEYRQQPPHLLSAGQIQKLALADVIAMQPQAVIFDEVTTMIDPVGRRLIMDTMRRMLSHGITIIFITHFMEEAVQADRILLMGSGRILKDGKPAQIFDDGDFIRSVGLELPQVTSLAGELHQIVNGFPEKIFNPGDFIEAMIKNKEKFLYSNFTEVTDLHPKIDCSTSPIISVSGLDFTYMKDTPFARQALKGINLSVADGECHGLAGITGSGKSTLLQHLNGLIRPQAGSVKVGSIDLNDPKVKLNTVIQMVGLVFQNPEMQFFEQFVGDEISYGPRQVHILESLAERVRWAMEMVGLDFESYKDRLVYSLSGGEKRKVALASTLALKPSILLLDEPTAGLDPRSRREIMGKLNQLKNTGITLVISSHQMEVLGAMCDTLTLLNKGLSIVSGPPAEIFYQPDALVQNGLEAPLIPQIVMSLQHAGMPFSNGMLSSQALISTIEQVRPA